MVHSGIQKAAENVRQKAEEAKEKAETPQQIGDELAKHKNPELVGQVTKELYEEMMQDPKTAKRLRESGLDDPAKFTGILGKDFNQKIKPEIKKIDSVTEIKISYDKNGKPKVELPDPGPEALNGDHLLDKMDQEKMSPDERDEFILEQIEKGNVNFNFKKVRAKMGSSVAETWVAGPITLGKEKPVIVPLSNQLAFKLRQKTGLSLPTKTLVRSRFDQAKQDGTAFAMITHPDGKPSANLYRDLKMKNKKYRALMSDLRSKGIKVEEQPPVGTGKVTVISDGAIRFGHEEFGGLEGKDLSNYTQKNPAHGAGGHKYADYSKEGYVVGGKVNYYVDGKLVSSMDYEDALRDPIVGTVLNQKEKGEKYQTGPIDMRKFDQQVAKRSKTYDKESA